MDTSDVLLAARDALREHGWTQRSTRRENGSVCLVGALAYVQESGYDVNTLSVTSTCTAVSTTAKRSRP